MKLVAVEMTAQKATENVMDAVNQKEIAEAALKQAQSMEKLYKERAEKFEELAEDSEKHMQQASAWRDKYDSMCHLVERLEGNNIEVKAKYESAVQLAKVLGKQLKAQQNQTLNLKTANSTNITQQKNLNKYLKSAIQVIDALCKFLLFIFFFQNFTVFSFSHHFKSLKTAPIDQESCCWLPSRRRPLVLQCSTVEEF